MCPVLVLLLGKHEALELISEIEARKLEQLKVNTLETQMKSSWAWRLRYHL